MSRPSADAQLVVTVDAGTNLDVVDSDGGWYWVSLPPNPNGAKRRGWIHAKDVEVVTPANSNASQPGSLAPGPTIPPLPLSRQEATRSVEPAPRNSVPALEQHDRGSLYIAPTGDGFEVYLAAAVVKKGVPVTVLDHESGSTYTLKAAKIETKQVGGGTKLVNCLFASCAGNEDKGNTSVQLVQDGVIKWSYSVNKGRGEKNMQSMAEAIAKHLKGEFFEK
jgi:hypothetical protein